MTTETRASFIESISTGIQDADIQTLSLINSILHPNQSRSSFEIFFGEHSTEIQCFKDSTLNGVVVDNAYTPISNEGLSKEQIQKIRTLISSEDEENRTSGFLLAETLIQTKQDLYLLMGITLSLEQRILGSGDFNTLSNHIESFFELEPSWEYDEWEEQDVKVPHPLVPIISLWTVEILLLFKVEWILNITQMNVSRFQLTELPKSIAQLTNLRHLNIQNNHLTQLPQWIEDLTQLKSLAFLNNPLESLPSTLSSIIKDEAALYKCVPCQNCSSFEDLKEIFIGEHCGYLALWTLGMLAAFKVPWVLNMTSLDFSESNPLKHLPESIGHFTHFSEVYLYDSDITELPQSFGNLTLLTYLELISNQLASLPDSIENLTLLKGLRLNSNQLTSLPDSIGNLTQLEYLSLRDNQLSDSEKEKIRAMMSHVDDVSL